MNRTVRFTAPREVEVVDLPEPAPGPGEVRLRTLYSGISAGTELTMYRGSNPYLDKRWDPDRRLFVPGEGGQTAYPVDGWGYEEVGRVEELGTGVERPAIGELVWGAWGHRETVVQPAEFAARRVLPAGTEPLVGIFSEIGAIALNVVLDADLHVGETAVVFGLGVPGQLVAQLARLNGARVIGVDMLPGRRDLALELGADAVLDPAAGDVAAQVADRTDGRGADVCLEVSGVYAALQEAVRTAAYSARVVAAGFFQGAGQALALGEEFHHNRVQVVASQISGVAPALSYRWDGYRLRRTAVELAATGRLRVQPLVTHVLPVGEAPAAFELLDRTPERALQVVLDFGPADG